MMFGILAVARDGLPRRHLSLRLRHNQRLALRNDHRMGGRQVNRERIRTRRHADDTSTIAFGTQGQCGV
jgi:hypothetical protein